MNKVFGLLILGGLLAAVYLNREKIAEWRGGPKADEAETQDANPDKTASEAPRAKATPNPARESQALAARLYPGLNIANSPLNRKFLALHAEAQATDPALLTRPDWPIKLAERAVVAMGGAPMPIPATPSPGQGQGLMGSSLDKKPDAMAPHRPK